jgi:transcription elongation factor Elf1
MRVLSGQPIRYKNNHLYSIACCNCGYVHVVKYRIIGNEIEVKVWVDEYATRQARKRKK